MNFIIKYKFNFIGLVLGAIVGYLYYIHIGCTNGTCVITSNPVNSALYGALLGVLVVNMFQK
jgi:hypothetical protein